MENLAEMIFARRAKEANPEWICEVLEQLMWLTEDYGKEISETLKGWLVSEDLEKIKIALSSQEHFLFRTRGEMTQVFSDVCRQHPELQHRCDEIVARWDKQGLPTWHSHRSRQSKGASFSSVTVGHPSSGQNRKVPEAVATSAL